MATSSSSPLIVATDTSDSSSLARFDPTSDLFVAQFAKPAALKPVNMRALSPMQRALLVIDGTVTKFIEAYALEPVDVTRLGQAEQTLTEVNEWLQLPVGTKVITRHVMLIGRFSGTFYAYAGSLIAPERIPATVRAGLNETGGSLGRLLLSSRLESRREVLWYGRERLEDLPPHVQSRYNGEFLTRTYRVIMGGAPLMMITERFPASAGSGVDEP